MKWLELFKKFALDHPKLTTFISGILASLATPLLLMLLMIMKGAPPALYFIGPGIIFFITGLNVGRIFPKVSTPLLGSLINLGFPVVVWFTIVAIGGIHGEGGMILFFIPPFYLVLIGTSLTGLVFGKKNQKEISLKEANKEQISEKPTIESPKNGKKSGLIRGTTQRDFIWKFGSIGLFTPLLCAAIFLLLKLVPLGAKNQTIGMFLWKAIYMINPGMFLLVQDQYNTLILFSVIFNFLIFAFIGWIVWIGENKNRAVYIVFLFLFYFVMSARI